MQFFDDIVLTSSVEVPDETIPSLGHPMGLSMGSYAKKTKSTAKLLGMEPKTSNGKTKKKKANAKKK
jgi:hypothetical protein